MNEELMKVLEKVRKGLQQDGGDVELVSFEDGVVKVRLKGACHGCPMGMQTLKMGIETHLKQKIPQVKSVIGAGEE